MKKLLILAMISLLYHSLKAQNFIPVKDTIVQNTVMDSMYKYSFQKTIPFIDSGIVVLSYCDSNILNPTHFLKVVVTAFDKNLNLLWLHKFPLSQNYTATLSAVTDSNYTLYFTYDNGNGCSLVEISPNGSLLLNKPIYSQISSNISIINGIAFYYDKVLVYGNIFNSQTSFAPFMALFDKNGNLYKKKIFPSNPSTSYLALYTCSMLNITKENNISITYQNDTLNNYMVACYDSSFNKIWGNIININLGFTYNFFNQGKNVALINMDVGHVNGNTATFKFDSKTGSGGIEVDHTYNFKGVYAELVLPTKSDKYLNFGDFPSGSGWDNAIDYFDDHTQLGYIVTNASGSTNYMKSACIIGSYVYTVAIRYIDKYTDSTFLRGVLWINKYNTDFLNLPAGVREISDQNDRLKVWPNPFSDQIFIGNENTENDVKVMLFDQLGHSIPIDRQITNGMITFDTKQLSKGIYFVNVSVNGEIKRSKILKF